MCQKRRDIIFFPTIPMRLNEFILLTRRAGAGAGILYFHFMLSFPCEFLEHKIETNSNVTVSNVY